MPNTHNQQLIPVFTGEISGTTVQLVDARLLHEFLESSQRFADWIKNRISDYGFIENQDFLLHKFMKQTGSGGHNKIDYYLTLDTAKEISMVERNEKGQQARRYFIDCERRLQQAKPMQFSDLPTKPSPFLNVDSGLLRNLMKFPKAVSEVYLMDCGVTPEYIAYRQSQPNQNQTINRAQLAPPKPERQPLSVWVVRFVADWQNGLLGAPFVPCLGEQVINLFRRWVPEDQPVNDYAEVMTELYKHPMLYRQRNCIDRATNNHRVMTMINLQKPAEGQSYYEYVTESIEKMEHYFRGS